MLLSLLRPGSIRDTMHLRALLETMMPEISHRTLVLRAEIDRSRQLRAKALAAMQGLRTEQGDLAKRRQALAALEVRQRLALRESSGTADREAERALALAEEARDLDTLTVDLGRAGALRDRLALLPGPVMRPQRPDQSTVLAIDIPNAVPAAHAPPQFLMPVQGRLVEGFGVVGNGAARSRGVSIATRGGAQAVAPAAGRVAFAGPYRGYGAIVIVDHGHGWTSLVTGLAQLNVKVGQELVAGSPLGVAGPGNPTVSLELRRDGQPVNPLEFTRFG
jgi:septal ring factor EnvC (AmiA/AmiB activator)